MSGLAQFFKDGGFFMYVNLLWSIASIAVIVDRVYALFIRNSLNANEFMNHIQKTVRAGNIDRAIKYCNAAPNAGLPNVIKAALVRINKGEEAIQAAIDEAMVENKGRITKRLSSLWALANIATLVGLLGTITGLIAGFRSIGDPRFPAEKRAEALAKGISEAMNNTAFGLAIAVTCIIGHLLLSGTAKRILEDLDKGAMRLENLLFFKDEAPSATGGSAPTR
jgi:biopolymer transport protein ExbB/TolQ